MSRVVISRALQVGLEHRERRAVVREATDAGRLAGVRGVEHDNLAAGRARPVGITRRLAVEAQVRRRLLDEAVRLARHDERVGREPHVQSLPAAPECEQQLVGAGADACRHCDRSLDRRDGRTKRLDRIESPGEPARHERRNHLGVRRDLGRHPEVVGREQVGVVVDVAIERTDDIGTVGIVDLRTVERMRVGFGDQADTRPPRMTQHETPRRIGSDGAVQQRVVDDRGA